MCFGRPESRPNNQMTTMTSETRAALGGDIGSAPIGKHQRIVLCNTSSDLGINARFYRIPPGHSEIDTLKIESLQFLTGYSRIPPN